MRVEEVMKLFEQADDKDNYVIDSWCREDVEGCAKENGYRLKPEEVSQVLADMRRSHDAEHGINWDFILSCIEEVRSNRKRGRRSAS